MTIADAWSRLTSEQKRVIMLAAPEFYFAAARAARREQVARGSR